MIKPFFSLLLLLVIDLISMDKEYFTETPCFDIKKHSGFFLDFARNSIETKILVKAMNKFVSKDEYLFFPSTGYVPFINVNTVTDTNDPVALLETQDGCCILPNLQFWVHKKHPKIRIDNDLLNIKTSFSEFYLFDDRVCVMENYLDQCVLDVNGLFVVDVCAGKILDSDRKLFFGNEVWLRDLHNNKAIKLELTFNCLGFFSVCFHQKKELEFSLIDKKIGQMMICGIENRTFPDQQDIEKYVLAFQKNISIKTNLKNDIIKHEYIGNYTFIILADFLYFGLVDHATDTMTLSKQIFPGKVISFSANQDHDKKTEQGRTRFIAVLVNQGDLENPAEQKQKVFLLDIYVSTLKLLWESQKKACAAEKNDSESKDSEPKEKDFFDKISFGEDTILLWSFDNNTAPVKEIILHPDWSLWCDLKLLCQIAQSIDNQTQPVNNEPIDKKPKSVTNKSQCNYKKTEILENQTKSIDTKPQSVDSTKNFFSRIQGYLLRLYTRLCNLLTWVCYFQKR